MQSSSNEITLRCIIDGQLGSSSFPITISSRLKVKDLKEHIKSHEFDEDKDQSVRDFLKDVDSNKLVLWRVFIHEESRRGSEVLLSDFDHTQKKAMMSWNRLSTYFQKPEAGRIHIVVNKWGLASNHQQDQDRADDEASTLDQVKQNYSQVIIPHKAGTHDHSVIYDTADEDDFQGEQYRAEFSDTDEEDGYQSEQESVELVDIAEEDGYQSDQETTECFDTADEDDYSSVQETPEHFETVVRDRTAKRTFSSVQENDCNTPEKSKRVCFSDEEKRESFERIHLIHQAQDAIRKLNKHKRRPTLDLLRSVIDRYGPAREEASHSRLEELRKKAKAPRRQVRKINYRIGKIYEWKQHAEDLDAFSSMEENTCDPPEQDSAIKTICFPDQERLESLE
ncbi:hypothetical protein BGZ75_010410, partial [Mortierella antarctica]